ncbi:MAG: helix-turn-helix domain-containing protein [Mucilaginibacter sp.]
MAPYTFHITLFDLAILGTVFIGLTFALLLGFTKTTNRPGIAIGLALFVIVLQLVWILGIAIGLDASVPSWSWLPLQFSLATGPLIYFYVRRLTRPDYHFSRKDLLHFSPLLLELSIHVLEVRESIKIGAATYHTAVFQHLNPVLQFLAFISVAAYLYGCHKLVEGYYQRLNFVGGDRCRHQLRWLHRLVLGFGLLWLLWIPYTAGLYFYYPNQLNILAHAPLYLLLAVSFTRFAIVVYLIPEADQKAEGASARKPMRAAELKQRATWLKKAVKANLYYQNPELSLSSLAERLGLGAHELSRIINTVLKKSFNDFINEYRVADVVQKMQDPAYDHITLLGIAFESGFSSQSTFNRIFKQMTGKSPLEYKNNLKKEQPSYNMGSNSKVAPVILSREHTPEWGFGQIKPQLYVKKLSENSMA